VLDGVAASASGGEDSVVPGELIAAELASMFTVLQPLAQEIRWVWCDERRVIGLRISAWGLRNEAVASPELSRSCS
jgi:hypothetical protein